MKYFRDLLKNLDLWLVLIPMMFACISVLMIGSTAYDGAFVFNRSMKVQVLAYGLGFVLMLFLMFFNYAKFQKVHWYLYVFALLFLLTVYIPGLGSEQYGSRAWLDLGVIYLQPSEIVKILFILCYACYLTNHAEALKTWKGFFWAVLYVCPFLGIIVVLQNDLGNAIVLFVAAVFMLFAAGLKASIFAISAGAAAAAMPVAYHFMSSHQRERIAAFLYPDDLSLSGNYQVWNSKVAIGSGGFWGKGLFQGTQKALDFLPVQDSDFIFAVICEELGVFGGLCIILLYAFFLLRVLRVSRRAKDSYGSLVTMGIFAFLLFQVFENIGMTMGLMPVTGITLPFISAGGTSIMTNMMAIGILLSINIRNKLITF